MTRITSSYIEKVTLQYPEHLIDCRANHNQTYDDRQRIIRQDNPLIILHYSRSRPKVGMGRGGGPAIRARESNRNPSSQFPLACFRLTGEAERQTDRHQATSSYSSGFCRFYRVGLPWSGSSLYHPLTMMIQMPACLTC